MNDSDMDIALSDKFDGEGSLITNAVPEPNHQISSKESEKQEVISDNLSSNNTQMNEGLVGDINWNVSTIESLEAANITSTSAQHNKRTDSDVCNEIIDFISNQDNQSQSTHGSENNHSLEGLQIGNLTLIDTSLADSIIDSFSIKNLNDNAMIIQNNSALNFHKGKINMNSTCSLDLDAEKASQSSATEESVSDIGLSSESLSSYNKGSSDIFEVPTPYDLNEVEKYKEEVSQLKHIISRLKEEQTRLNVEASHTTCLSQLDQQRREIELFKQEHELDLRSQATMKLEMDALKKQYESANKEKEASVMRYATSEMEVIKQRNERENMEKKYKEVLKDKEGLTTKLKNTMVEKARISLLLDNKCSELFNAQKDIEKLKEELNSRDIKIKWTQNKLKTELESHKESEAQVEKLSSLIQESKDEVEKAKKEAEAAIKQFQCSQENKAFVLEQQLREVQAQLILERHNLEDKENSVKQLTHEVDALLSKQQLYIDENNALKLKASSLEKEKQENETTILRLRDNVDKTSQEVGELQEKTCDMESLRLQLKQEKDKVSQLQTEMSELKASNEELLSDMASCREREAEMLEFTQKVTAKNVRLQSEFSCIESKARQLEFAEEPLQRQIDELTRKTESLQKELNKERADRAEEKRVVARHLAEKTARAEVLTKEVEDLKGENQVMKHKQATSLRELNREVQQYRRKLEQLESNSGSNSLCQGSRASSCNSLNDSSPTSTAVIFSGTTPLEPDKQTMVDRILRLQRENVRLREKIDFLEEHAKQLVCELQKKTRVLQSYILREEAGTLSSSGMDFNKAELSKHGGIMASVYGSKAVDDTMTLELSLEINRKLQAVLEDTLLKNITLKENIDTLGDEIRRLSRK